jgi:hypothetical protein
MITQRSIVCIVPDLLFAVQIENLARRHGLVVVAPADAQAFRTALARASLALIDAGTADRPWAEWVSAAKADPATRGTPIIAFGSHVNRALRERALEAGVDRYMARSNFVGALPEIIARAAREITDDACGEPLPDGALRGIHEFNEGKYFEQHETLERVWRAETRPVRDLYQGILQIGVALLQIERGNAPGTIKTFERAFRWLEPFRPSCQGIDVERLLRESHIVYKQVKRLGAERIGEISRSSYPHVHLLDKP